MFSNKKSFLTSCEYMYELHYDTYKKIRKWRQKGHLQLILCFASYGSNVDGGCIFFFPKRAYIHCFFNLSLIYWFSWCIFSFLCSLMCKGNERKLLIVALPRVWYLAVLCTQGVSLTILFFFHNILATMGWPAKYSFILNCFGYLQYWAFETRQV